MKKWFVVLLLAMACIVVFPSPAVAANQALSIGDTSGGGISYFFIVEIWRLYTQLYDYVIMGPEAWPWP